MAEFDHILLQAIHDYNDDDAIPTLLTKLESLPPNQTNINDMRLIKRQISKVGGIKTVYYFREKKSMRTLLLKICRDRKIIPNINHTSSVIVEKTPISVTNHTSAVIFDPVEEKSVSITNQVSLLTLDHQPVSIINHTSSLTIGPRSVSIGNRIKRFFARLCQGSHVEDVRSETHSDAKSEVLLNLTLQLISDLNSGMMDSSVTNAVMTMFEGIDNCLTDQDKKDNSQIIDDLIVCLCINHWKFPGFSGPPDRSALVIDLSTVIQSHYVY